MTEMVRQWLLAVTAAAMLVALAESMCPDGPVKRAASLVGGIVLLFAVLQPFATGEIPFFSLDLAAYQTDANAAIEEFSAENDVLTKGIIEEKCAAYIVDKAQALGAGCQAAVTCRWESDTAVPDAVTVTGELTGDQQAALSAIMTEDLGITQEKQSFEEGR